jgi:hypothetical protein
MSTLLKRKSAGRCSGALAVVACLAATPSLTLAQTPSTTNTALLSAKSKVTQAQTEQNQAKTEALQGQNALTKAQLDLANAKCALKDAQDKENKATQDVPSREAILNFLNQQAPKARPNPDPWAPVIKAAEADLAAAKKSLIDAQCALRDATADQKSKETAQNVAQGVYNQLQKDEQKTDTKLQSAIQSLLDQVQASTAAKPTQTAAASPNPLLLASALTPMYISPWGTPIGLYQPPTSSLCFASPCTPVVQGLQGVPPGCNPVPRVPVCSWTPGVLGATPVMTSGQQEALPLLPSSPASPPAEPAAENHSPVATSTISRSNSTLVREDAFSSLPSVKRISLDQEQMAREARDAPDDDAQTPAQSYASDYRFDLPARFALAQFGSTSLCPSFEGEGAVIHEGMRILTSKDGQYDIRFNVTVPAMPVTMRMQLLLYDNASSPFPKTLTLPPIRIVPDKDADHDDYDDVDNPPSGGTPFLSYLVRLRGYSHVVRDHSGTFQLARRIGTARFGSAVPPLYE